MDYLLSLISYQYEWVGVRNMGKERGIERVEKVRMKEKWNLAWVSWRRHWHGRRLQAFPSFLHPPPLIAEKREGERSALSFPYLTLYTCLGFNSILLGKQRLIGCHAMSCEPVRSGKLVRRLGEEAHSHFALTSPECECECECECEWVTSTIAYDMRGMTANAQCLP